MHTYQVLLIVYFCACVSLMMTCYSERVIFVCFYRIHIAFIAQHVDKFDFMLHFIWTDSQWLFTNFSSVVQKFTIVLYLKLFLLDSL